MFDYARNMQLALSDTGRRVALKAAAGAVIALGAGFLIAALWSFLAWNLGWGPVGASLAIGLLFVIVGVVLFSMSKTVKHPVPSTDELKADARVRLERTRREVVADRDRQPAGAGARFARIGAGRQAEVRARQRHHAGRLCAHQQPCDPRFWVLVIPIQLLFTPD